MAEETAQKATKATITWPMTLSWLSTPAAPGATVISPFFTHWRGRMADTRARPVPLAGAVIVLTNNNATLGRTRSGPQKGPARSIYAEYTMERTYRVVVAKPGLDGHDRGAKVIARTLRDAGFEVVYTGLHQTPEQIVQAVIQEDADALGLSLLSGAHNVLVPRILELLKDSGREDVLLIVGGIIPDADIATLEAAGVARVFTPGASLDEIGTWLESALDSREVRQ
jgi:methylmalonyl-CoA mutase C-terminal domain/subunit